MCIFYYAIVYLHTYSANLILDHQKSPNLIANKAKIAKN